MNQTYQVKAGDTLYGISNQFGVSLVDLTKLNNISDNTLFVGQILKIPTSSGTNPNNIFNYTVKKGDTLYSIASRYNTTVNEIKKLNNLTNNDLSLGQILKIPEMYDITKELPNYVNYIVKKGDTLYSIAKSNGVSVDTIVKDNSLSSNNLSLGQILKIRINETNEEILECFGEDYIPPVNENVITYTVKKGDTIFMGDNEHILTF